LELALLAVAPIGWVWGSPGEESATQRYPTHVHTRLGVLQTNDRNSVQIVSVNRAIQLSEKCAQLYMRIRYRIECGRTRVIAPYLNPGFRGKSR
jgi:hypothetical protein